MCNYIELLSRDCSFMNDSLMVLKLAKWRIKMLYKQINMDIPYVKSFDSLPMQEKESIITFIDKQIDRWYTEHPHDSFSAVALFGKSQFKDWSYIPLGKIYDSNLSFYNGDEDQAKRQSGIDVGYLLKWRCTINQHPISMTRGYFLSYNFV